MINKVMGNKFEQEFCKKLADNGYWVHNMANRKNGQPVDVIAVKDGIAFLFDCKVCTKDVFVLSRIEDNQHMAMRQWELCGNNQGMFALKTSAGVYLIKYGVLQTFETVTGKKSMNLSDIKKHSYKLGDYNER